MTKNSLDNNYYVVIYNIKICDLTNILETNGWKSRKAGFDEYELSNDWSEFLLQTDKNDVLLSGVVINESESEFIMNYIFKNNCLEYKY